MLLHSAASSKARVACNRQAERARVSAHVSSVHAALQQTGVNEGRVIIEALDRVQLKCEPQTRHGPAAHRL